MSPDDRSHASANAPRNGLSTLATSRGPSRPRVGWLPALVGAFAFFCAPAPSESAERAALPSQSEGLAWPTQAWPTGASVPGSDNGALTAAFDAAFQGKEPLLGETRAVIVAEGGRIVAERYADGFGPETKFVSWSMAKSITHALVGAAVLQGRLDIDKPMGNPHWLPGDERSAITWRQWLNMVDGQRYSELGAASTTDNDVARMLFGAGRLDAAAHAASLPLIHAVGAVWNYNSAGTILVCDALTRVLVPAPASAEARRAAMLAWMHASLFEPIGMASAQPEFDAQGLFLGGSLVYATARDFAKFGLLYLRDGIWDGKRILPAGWVDFARTPSPAPNGDVYGAGWWINPPVGTGQAMYSYVDTGPMRDAFEAQGHEGQMILLVPTKDLVIVRLGRFADRVENWKALEDWMGRVARAFPAAAAP